MATLHEKIRLFKGLLSGNTAYAGPFYITVDLTRRCNLRCPFCLLHSSDQNITSPSDKGVQELSFPLFKKICSELQTTDANSVILIGEGEPFLYPRLFDCISMAKEAGLHVTLLTNGTLLDEEKIQLLIDRRLDILKVSLWASSVIEYQKNYPGMNPENFHKIVNGLQRLSQAKTERGSTVPVVTLHQPLTRQNYKHIDAMVDLVHETGCTTLSFSPLKTFRGALRSNGLSPNEENCLKEHLTQISNRLHASNLKHNISETLSRYEIGEEVWEKLPCYIGWFHARIKVDGTVLPCNQCNLVMGNLHESGLKDIWNGSAYRQFRKRTLTREGLKNMGKDCDCGFCCHVNDNVRVHQIFKWFSCFGRRK